MKNKINFIFLLFLVNMSFGQVCFNSTNLGLLNNSELINTEPIRVNEIWVDGDATLQGDGTQNTPFKDFYFLGGRTNTGSKVKSRIPIDPATDIIRVKGTFRFSDHIQDVDGSSMRIELTELQLSDGNGSYNITSPDSKLIFAPWPEESGPVFDGEGNYFPTSGHYSSNDQTQIFLAGGTSNFLDVEIRGFEVKNQKAPVAIFAFEGVRTLWLISCYVHDNLPQSQSTAMNGGIAFKMTATNSNHLVKNCLIENNDNGVTNNVGEINWESSITNTIANLNTLTISNSIINDSYSALTGKKSGNVTVVVNNCELNNHYRALYGRGHTFSLNHSIFNNISFALVQPSYENFKTSNHITLDHITAINCNSVMKTTNDTPVRANGDISWTVTNSVFIDTDFTSPTFFSQAIYDDGSLIPTTFNQNNNVFDFNASAMNNFFERDGGGNYNFSNTLLFTSDATSIFETADIDNITFSPLIGGNCFNTGSDNSQIGALCYETILGNTTVDNSQTIKIFPNPTKGDILILSEEPNVSVIIRNTLGQTVGSFNNIDLRNRNIRIEGHSGFYFLELYYKGKKTTFKIIKN